MLQRFVESLREIVGDDFAQKKYLLAVSGGADSTVMAQLFNCVNLNFSIAHCNFHLRGKDSDRDMKFVENLSQNLNTLLFVKEFDTLEIQKKSKKSVEMVARELRYNWFCEIIEGYDFLVTAHNANDAAETLLININRGTGLKGLRSIPKKNGNIIRPMLAFSAKEIRDWAKNNKINFVEDYTNSDETIKRNRIRHSVLPIFEELNPNFLQTIQKTIHLLTKQYDFYNHYLQSEIEKVSIIGDNEIKIDRKKLANLPDSQIVLYEILSKFNFSDDSCNKLVSDKKLHTGKIFNSNSHTLLVERECFLIKKNIENLSQEIVINNLSELKKYFKVEEYINNNDIIFDKNPLVFFIPKEKLQFPLTIRHWRKGDYFYPFGAKGKKKLSDFFINNKINLFEKNKIKLLCCENQIMWIIGYRSDERFKINKYSKTYYKITFFEQINEK